MSSTQRELLKKRLEENYAAYIARLTKKSFADLIDAAEEIAAARLICEALVPACSDSDAELLLRFDDPLELMRDRFLDEIDGNYRGLLDHALWTVQDKAEEFLTHYVPARPQAADGLPLEVMSRPQIQLAGPDEDIHAVVDRAVCALMLAGCQDQAGVLSARAFGANERDAVLQIVRQFVEIEPLSTIQSTKTGKKEKKPYER